MSYENAMFKNKLQQYAQKMCLGLPVYDTVKEGKDHLPSFRSCVTVNGVCYESTLGHKNKKEAEQSAAQVAVEDLCRKEPNHQFEEIFGKRLLSELAASLGWDPPTYTIEQRGLAHSPDITSTVEVGGASYVGGVAKCKKDADAKAAFVAFLAIKAQRGEPSLRLECHAAESKGTCDIEQSLEECKDIKIESKINTNGCTRKIEFVTGTNCQEAENALENLNVLSTQAVEMGSEKSNAIDLNSECATLLHNRLERETIVVQQRQLDSESKDVVKEQECGSQETGGEHQGVQEVVSLQESVNKRNRSEFENSEHKKKKKNNKKKKDKTIDPSGTATGN